MNPEPVAPFFDAILIGEGEEALPQFVDLCRTGLDERDALLRTLDTTPGWYVPSCARPTATTRTSARWSCGSTCPPSTRRARSTPDTEFSNMHLHGDRARLWTRLSASAWPLRLPAREQPLDLLLASAERPLPRAVPRSAWSARGGERPHADRRTSRGPPRHGRKHQRQFHAHGPHQRAPHPGHGCDRRAESHRRLEAGSQRLRNVINKTQTEEQMMRAISLAQECNFPQLKLYFMVGHPTETDDDIQAIIDFTLAAQRVQAAHRHQRHAVCPQSPHAVSVGSHDVNPSSARRQKTIYRSAGGADGVDVRADSPDWAEVQAVLSGATGA
ncbi:MAG: hypothetical protein R2838_00815 [Caldilineaceae bacterium]